MLHEDIYFATGSIYCFYKMKEWRGTWRTCTSPLFRCWIRDIKGRISISVYKFEHRTKCAISPKEHIKTPSNQEGVLIYMFVKYNLKHPDLRKLEQRKL